MQIVHNMNMLIIIWNMRNLRLAVNMGGRGACKIMGAKTIPGTQSFTRTMGVLQLVADAEHAPSAADLLEMADLTRPTLHRILTVLEAEDLIYQTPARRFVLGSRLVSLAQKALGNVDVRDVARPFLEQLRDDTGETVHLAIRSRDELIYIDKVESRETVRMASSIGAPVPFHSSAVGKAFLAGFDEATANQMIDGLDMRMVTPFTTTSRERLSGIVTEARQQGYVYDDQENEAGIVCFGGVIRDASGLPAASVSVSVPLFRLKKDHGHYTKPLIRQVAAISARMGHVD